MLGREPKRGEDGGQTGEGEDDETGTDGLC